MCPTPSQQILSTARRYFLITSSNSPSEKGSFATARWCRHLENCSKLEPLPPSYLLCVRGVGWNNNQPRPFLNHRAHAHHLKVGVAGCVQWWARTSVNGRYTEHASSVYFPWRQWWSGTLHIIISATSRAEPVLTTESLQSLRLLNFSCSVLYCTYPANFNIQVWPKSVWHVHV